MSKLSPIKAKKLIKIILLLGFIKIRSIGIGLIRAILHDIQISPEQFNNLLKK